MAQENTKRTTKAQVWADVLEVLQANKASKKIIEQMEELLAPKSGGGAINPPKLDEKGNIIEAYCRFHSRYEPVENMVISGGKSKGYCKASISLWNKTNAKIKKLNDLAVVAMSEGNMEEAQKCAKESEALKKVLNAHESYDFDRDWAEFNKVTTEAK